MSPLFDANNTSTRDNSFVEIVALNTGGTALNIQGVTRSDGVNALATDSVTSLAPGSVQRWNSKLRYLDMNATNGGVARDTLITDAAWVNIFSYTGSGILASFLAKLETGADWEIRLVIDNEEIFDTNGLILNEVTSDSFYDLDKSGKSLDELFYGSGVFLGAHDQFRFSSPLMVPIAFSTNVSIKVRRSAGKAAKKFQAGLVVIQRDT